MSSLAAVPHCGTKAGNDGERRSGHRDARRQCDDAREGPPADGTGPPDGADGRREGAEHPAHMLLLRPLQPYRGRHQKYVKR